MSSAVGTFTVEDSFHITGRGLVLLGKVAGQVSAGYQLVFRDATRWKITAVNFGRENIGLLVDAPLTPREELLRRGIIWDVAQIFAP